MIHQRRSPRVSLAQPIEFSLMVSEVRSRHEGAARDISLGGMFIEDGHPVLALGNKVVVYLTLPGGKREMELPTLVRWTSKDGMGVQ